MDPVDVGVSRTDREGATDRDTVGDAEADLEARWVSDMVGLPVDVFEDSRLRVGLGEAEDVLEPVVVAVWVLERRVLRVLTGLDVAVRVVSAVAVSRGLRDAVFETRLLRVSRLVERIDFVDVVLGLGRRVPALE